MARECRQTVAQVKAQCASGKVPKARYGVVPTAR
jgi:hypothetical protein